MVKARLDIALVHYPVVNRRGEEIGSAVTNLDIHDIARAARTYGAERFYIVTPYPSQVSLVFELISHWTKGPGGEHNPDRRDALSLVRLAPSLDEAAANGEAPLLVGTSAQATEGLIEWPAARDLLAQDRRVLLAFGTASGLSPRAVAKMDCFLPPLQGAGGYNHLSVRSAVSIVLDRLLGER